MQFDFLSKRLKGIEEASIKGSPIRKLHRLIFMPEIWQEAYANIYANKGAITKGINENTLDGFSMKRVEGILQKIRKAKYRFTPVRRAYIPKRNDKRKKRPLGLPTGDDKLLQEVTRIILQRAYEPIFSQHSHGFRPRKSCHTALEQVRKTWKGVKWFIEIDIKGFFDNMNHDIMIELLKKKVDDKCLINLIKGMLKAGYLEEWKYYPTYSGVPQGGIISPLLSNIYLHETDKLVENLMTEFNKSKRRPPNPEYKRLDNRRYKLRKKIKKEGRKPELIEEWKQIGKMMREIPSQKVSGDEYKRLKYCRYADDFILGITGTKADAKEIMQKVVAFLHDELSLQISEKKSGIKLAKKGISFLSYHIHRWRSDKTIRTKVKKAYTTKRTVNEHIRLQVPQEKVKQFCSKYGYGDWYQNKPKHRPALLRSSDAEIVMTYNGELRGLANYYCLADNVKVKLKKLEYLAHYSLFKTVAGKRKTKIGKILKKLKRGNEFIYRYKVQGKAKELKVFKLKHMSKKPKDWNVDYIPNTLWLTTSRSELTKRLNQKECEYCGRKDSEKESHHVKKLKDLRGRPNLQLWQKVMIARNRKTMIICCECPEIPHVEK
jgi:RNA-directed DNA polymerase